jgi:hypothetical protein
LLVDEFQFVYCQPREIGTEIIREIAGLSDSNLGVNHMIVSGSSTNLRKLAFAKLPRDEATRSTYPSFEGIDLNSTKLRPHWIFPFVNWNDAKNFCQKFLVMDSTEAILEKFILGGGRPGIMLNVERDVPYSLNPDRLLRSQPKESKILVALYECLQLHLSIPLPQDDQERFCESLKLVDRNAVHSRLQDLEMADFLSGCDDLVDSGAIIFHDGTFATIGFSSIYTFLAARQLSRKTLTRKPPVALKLRTGIFATLAEEVVLDLIRDNHSSLDLFGVQEISTDFFGEKTPQQTPIIPFRPPIPDDLILGKLHKEIVDNKDHCGGDGIFIQLVEENKYKVLIRIQIKIRGQNITAGEVDEIRDRMNTRGKFIIKQIQER